MIQVLRHVETREMEITADPDGLVALARAVANAPAVVETEVPETTWPYDQALTSIRVETSESLVLIDHDEAAAAMLITGRPESREVLAGNLTDFAQEGKPGDHLHVDWFPDHFYLGEGSDSVVVSFDQP